MDISDHCFLVSVHTGLIHAGRRVTGILYHGRFISLYHLPEQKFTTKRNAAENDALFAGQFFAVSALSAICILAILHCFLYLEKSGFFPPSDLLLGRSQMGILYINALLVALFVNFGCCGLRFHKESMKLHEALLESQFQILQQQISPHFMFNVLNHINIFFYQLDLKGLQNSFRVDDIGNNLYLEQFYSTVHREVLERQDKTTYTRT